MRCGCPSCLRGCPASRLSGDHTGVWLPTSEARTTMLVAWKPTRTLRSSTVMRENFTHLEAHKLWPLADVGIHCRVVSCGSPRQRCGRASTSVAARGGMWAKVSHLAGCPLVATQTRGRPYRRLPLWSSTLCCGLALCASGHVARLVGACGRPRSVLGVNGHARVLCGRAFVGARAYVNGKNPCPKGAEARCGDVGSVISQP